MAPSRSFSRDRTVPLARSNTVSSARTISSPSWSRTSCSEMGAAAAMRPACALPCRSATTRYGSRASLSAGSSSAPRPLAKTYLPGSPRALATRSGQAWTRSAPVLAVAADRDRSPAACASRAARLRAAAARGDRSLRKTASRWSRSGDGPPRPRSVSRTASSAAALACPDRAAITTMCARRAGSASPRIALPSTVMRPSPSSAPRRTSRDRASSSAGLGGGSRKASADGSAMPKAAQSRSSPDRSASSISGGVKARSAFVCSARQRRIATPGSVRPARPARWSAEARETRKVSSRVRPVDGSNFGRRDQPLSMTMRTPSMVIEVSAIAVASTTLRRPAAAGRIASSCAPPSRPP